MDVMTEIQETEMGGWIARWQRSPATKCRAPVKITLWEGSCFFTRDSVDAAEKCRVQRLRWMVNASSSSSVHLDGRSEKPHFY